MTPQQELDALREKVFLTSRHPKEEKDLWTKVENAYNDLLSENLRLRKQLADSNIAYNAKAESYMRFRKALEIVRDESGSHTVEKLDRPARGGDGLNYIYETSNNALEFKEK